MVLLPVVVVSTLPYFMYQEMKPKRNKLTYFHSDENAVKGDLFYIFFFCFFSQQADQAQDSCLRNNCCTACIDNIIYKLLLSFKFPSLLFTKSLEYLVDVLQYTTHFNDY